MPATENDLTALTILVILAIIIASHYIKISITTEIRKILNEKNNSIDITE